MNPSIPSLPAGRPRPASWHRSLVLPGLLALGLSACGGGGGGVAEPVASVPDASALAVSRPGELLDFARSRLRARLAAGELVPPVPSAPGLVATVGATGDLSWRSVTTAQEPGVDEADLLKSDGQFVYSLDTVRRGLDGQPAPRLQAHRRSSDGSLQSTAVLPLANESGDSSLWHGLYLAEASRRLVAVRERLRFLTPPCGPDQACIAGSSLTPFPWSTSSEVQLELSDAPADGSLRAWPRISLTGRLVGTRLIGQTLVVVSSHTPSLAPDRLPANASSAEREAAIAALQTADLLPTWRRGTAAAVPLVRDTDCYLQPANASTAVELTTISLFDLSRPDAAPVSRCIAGGSEALYLSPRSLWLATTRTAYTTTADSIRYPATIRTDLHKFVLDSGVPSYRGSGSVAGHLGWDRQRKPYRLSEHSGDLRVLSFTGESGWASLADAGRQPVSPATLTVLRETPGGAALQQVSQLPNARRPQAIGKPGEQIYGVRFIGDRAYAVTFRVVDPLYVIDLADPTDPRVTGELEVTGYSDTLLPLADGLLLGIGRAADAQGRVGGLQVGLYDVRDPARPALLGTELLGERGSASGLDLSPQGVNLRVAGGQARVLLPVTLATAGTVAPAYRVGLQRLEVDLAARRLVRRPLVDLTGNDPWIDLWAVRSLQFGDQLVYLARGELSARAWVSD